MSTDLTYKPLIRLEYEEDGGTTTYHFYGNIELSSGENLGTPTEITETLPDGTKNVTYDYPIITDTSKTSAWHWEGSVTFEPIANQSMVQMQTSANGTKKGTTGILLGSAEPMR